MRMRMRAHPEAGGEGSQNSEHPSSEKSLAPPGKSLPALLDPRMSSRDFGIYGPSKYTTAAIPMATNAMKIRVPATTLSPVSR